MAPRKPAAETIASAKSATKKSHHGVVKRPARGYHRFKNGMLNVTPKGREKALVRSNQESPLLSLPPEIRNLIWHYVLGGINFRQTYDGSTNRPFKPQASERDNVFALLRVSRQIYAETALLPSSINTFSAISGWGMTKAVRSLRPYQRNQIKELRVEIRTCYLCREPYRYQYNGWLEKNKFALLPALQRIRVCIFLPTRRRRRVQPFAEYDEFLHSVLDDQFRHAGYDLVVEMKSIRWAKYVKDWNTRPKAKET